MVIIQLAKESFNPQPLPPKACPYCGCQGLSSFGRRQRKVRDLGAKQAWVQRCLCKNCLRTFSSYPEGLGHSPQSGPFMALVVTLYILGLSLRALPLALSLFQAPSISFITAWRDIQALGQSLRHRSLKSQITGVDTAFVPLRGKKQAIFIAVDLGGKVIHLEAVGNPEDYQRAFAHLRSLGVEVIVSDDDRFFRSPIEELGLRQQACLFHAKRALGRALSKLKREEKQEWQEVIALLKDSLSSLPPHPPESLFAAQRLPLPPPLRGIVVYLLNLWHRLTLYQHTEGLPRTNNLTERAILRSKIRARLVRGFGSLEGALNFFAVTQTWAV